MEKFKDLGLDYHDKKLSIFILYFCAYVVLMWMTEHIGNIGPINRHIRDTERGFYMQRVIKSNDINCLDMFRICKELFFDFFLLLRNRKLLHKILNMSKWNSN